MNDPRTVALVSLFFTAVTVLVPAVGAVLAGRAIRRRGRNARLAMIGCLVMVPGPIVAGLAMVLGFDPLGEAIGYAAAAAVLSGITVPFQLVGLALVLAGALSEPVPPSSSVRVGERIAG